MGLNGWGVARTLVAQEDCARRYAAMAGYETFLPRFRDYVVTRGVRQERVRNLFPGYLPFKIENGQWYEMRRVRGVLDVIRDGERPAVMKPSEIEYLQQRFDEQGSKKLTDGRFARGQRVRVLTGPYRDQEGTFECMRDRDRVVVLFQMLGREVPVEMGERELAAA